LCGQIGLGQSEKEREKEREGEGEREGGREGGEKEPLFARYIQDGCSVEKGLFQL
jgi:hypothetical protein